MYTHYILIFRNLLLTTYIYTHLINKRPLDSYIYIQYIYSISMWKCGHHETFLVYESWLCAETINNIRNCEVFCHEQTYFVDSAIIINYLLDCWKMCCHQVTLPRNMSEMRNNSFNWECIIKVNKRVLINKCLRIYHFRLYRPCGIYGI